MWTDYESDAAAKRTRAALARHAGRRVQATKVTVLEFYPDGRPVPGEKGAQQTRTRLEPGSLVLIDDQDEIIGPIDLAAAVEQTGPQRARAQGPAGPAAAPRATSPPPASAAKPAMVDAATPFQRLVERLGEDRATAAWGELPRSGSIPRPAAAARGRARPDGRPARPRRGVGGGARPPRTPAMPRPTPSAEQQAKMRDGAARRRAAIAAAEAQLQVARAP